MSTLYVVSPPRDIFKRLRPELRTHIVMLPNFLRYPSQRFKGLLRSLLVGRVPLPRRLLYWWFPKPYFDRLIHAQAGDAILIYEACNVRVLRAIRPYLPKDVPCHIYYCNPVHTTFRNPEEYLMKIRELGYRLTSFDPYEATQYGMTYTGQYFCYPDNRTDEIISDCFFCGLPKDRETILTDLRTFMESEGYKCDFIIPKSPADKITYPEYLRHLDQTRCVIDICQQGQAGLTRRPLEALFYNKKLITNNQEITQYDFYNPQNIFIFGKDSIDRLTQFMSTPIQETSRTIKDRYDINQWIRQYFND